MSRDDAEFGPRRKGVVVETEEEAEALSEGAPHGTEPASAAMTERVLRMLHGAAVPDEARLPQKDDGAPEALRAQLRALELEAFRQAGRLGELEAELVEAEREEERRDATRNKIIDRLRARPSDEDES